MEPMTKKEIKVEYVFHPLEEGEEIGMLPFYSAMMWQASEDGKWNSFMTHVDDEGELDSGGSIITEPFNGMNEEESLQTVLIQEQPYADELQMLHFELGEIGCAEEFGINVIDIYEVATDKRPYWIFFTINDSPFEFEFHEELFGKEAYLKVKLRKDPFDEEGRDVFLDNDIFWFQDELYQTLREIVFAE